MNSILLMDDREMRKRQYLSDEAFRQLQEDCAEFLTLANTLPHGGAELEEELKKHALIAIHKSWLDVHGLTNFVEDLTRREKIPFIIFSGGITQSLLTEGARRLNIGASAFYTNRLPDFFRAYAKGGMKQPLLELVYGKSWRLPLLLEYRQALWLDPESDACYDLEEQLRDLPPNEMPATLGKEWVDKEIEKEKLIAY